MRRLFFLALVTGCSFPNPEVIEGIVDSTATDTATREAATETGPDSSARDSTSDVVVDSLADSLADSAMDTAVADTREASTCIGTDLSCDCDGDGDKAKGKTGCLGGGDCDDGDPRRNSKVTSFLPDVPVGHTGDWDCNGSVQKDFADGINCGMYVTATTGCTQSGYKGTPACGSTAVFVRCKPGPLTNCTDDTTSMLVVKCK